MTVFRIKLFALSEGVHKDNDDKGYCINKNLMAMGWPLDNVDNVEGYLDKILKCKKYFKEGKPEGGLLRTLNTIKKVEKDDFIWAQKDGRNYLLGKVKSDLCIDKENPRLGLARECEWKEINFDDVPGKVISCFSGRGCTLQKIRKEDISEEYCKWLYNGKKDKVRIKDWKNLLHYDDLEDLLGLYLQDKLKWFVLPSTNKQSTKLIEYELRNKKGEKACVQCKIGNSEINSEKEDNIFEIFNNYHIFIVTITDKNYDNKGNNVKTIQIDKLWKWARNNQNLLPERIKNYVKLFDK